MFPYPDHAPPKLFEPLVGVDVTCTVAGDLPVPPLSIGLRPGAVLWAPVPEAAVYEDCELLSWKRDVNPSPRKSVDPELDAEPLA